MIALVLSFAAITLEVVATDNPMFFGGKFLNGFAIGTFQTVSTAYLGEVRRIQARSLPTEPQLTLRRLYQLPCVVS